MLPVLAGVWDDCGDGAGTCWSGPGVCPSPPPAPPAPPPQLFFCSAQAQPQAPSAPPPAHCYFQGQDYKVDGCGYADTLSIIDNRTDSDASSWFSGPRAVIIDLAHPSQCQELCANFTGCAFFSFEIQASLPEAKCYLKAAYTDPSCVGYSAPALVLTPAQPRRTRIGWLASGRTTCAPLSRLHALC